MTCPSLRTMKLYMDDGNDDDGNDKQTNCDLLRKL